MSNNLEQLPIERAASNVDGVRKGCLAAFSMPNSENGTEDLILVAETRETDPARKSEMEKTIKSEVLSNVGSFFGNQRFRQRNRNP